MTLGKWIVAVAVAIVLTFAVAKGASAHVPHVAPSCQEVRAFGTDYTEGGWLTITVGTSIETWSFEHSYDYSVFNPDKTHAQNWRVDVLSNDQYGEDHQSGRLDACEAPSTTKAVTSSTTPSTQTSTTSPTSSTSLPPTPPSTSPSSASGPPAPSSSSSSPAAGPVSAPPSPISTSNVGSGSSLPATGNPTFTEVVFGLLAILSGYLILSLVRSWRRP